MRVLFLTHSWPRGPGDAAGSFLLHLATALREQGVTVSVVAPAAPGLARRETQQGIEVHRFRYAPRRYENLAYTGNMATDVQRSWSARLALVGFLGSNFAVATRIRRSFSPDLIHAHWWFPAGLVGTAASSLSDLPLVTTMHGTDVRLARDNSFARPLLKHVLNRSRATTTVSRWLATEVARVVPGANVKVAPMPVATSLFHPSTSQPERHRARSVLFVGRLNAQKGIADLIRAVAATRTNAELDVVGHGTSADALRSLASEVGIAERVRWHGALPQDELPPLYRRAGTLVVPSIDEGLGLVAVEAQLCGTPVVAWASGGLVDVVRDGETGLLAPAGDIDRLSIAIDEILSNEERARDLAAAGRMAALAVFSPESVARRYAELYRSVVAL
ncbi:MAG: glycosyltransferase [Gemmatimonadota bacterium]